MLAYLESAKPTLGRMIGTLKLLPLWDHRKATKKVKTRGGTCVMLVV